MTLAQFGWKTGGCIGGKASQPFISEINRNAQPGLLDEETLYFIHGPDVLAHVCGVNALAVWSDAVQVLVDVGDAIFPNSIFPFGRWQLVLQWRFSAGSAPSNSIQGRRLAGLLFQVHL